MPIMENLLCNLIWQLPTDYCQKQLFLLETLLKVEEIITQ